MFHHHYPGLLMRWVKHMRPLLCRMSLFKTQTLFIQIYEHREGNGNNAFHSIISFWSLVCLCFNTRFLVWMSGLYSQSHKETWRKDYEFWFLTLCFKHLRDQKFFQSVGEVISFTCWNLGHQSVLGSLAEFLSFLLFFLLFFLPYCCILRNISLWLNEELFYWQVPSIGMSGPAE